MAKSFAIEDYFKGQTFGAVCISSNAKQVVYVLQEVALDQNRRRSNLFLADVETGRSFQLTNGAGKNDSPCWSPNGEWLAFLSDRPDPKRKSGDRSRAQIWLIRPDGGEAECLTRSKSAVSGFKWSPEGDRIVFMTVDALSKDEEKKKKDKDDARMIGQDARMTHLWAIDLKERKAQRLTRGRFHITGFDCSPNGRQLVYAYARTSVSDEARPINLAIIASGGGRRKVIVQRPGIDRSPWWSPDGKTIAFVSDGGVDDRQAESKLWVVPARGGESRCLLPAEDRFGGIGAWSPDSRFIYYGAQRGVRFHVRRVSVATGRSVGILEGDDVSASFCLSADGKSAAWIGDNGRRAPQVFVGDVRNNRKQQVSNVNEHFVDYRFGRKDIISWKSSDGLEIEGLLIKPVGYKPGRRCPLLVVVHGGPAGVFHNTFDATTLRGAYPLAVFANRGYALLLPNPRGSSGYGEAFRRANYKDWGGGDYHDIMTGVDALIDRGIAHPDRLGIMGWSYGGYMTAWAVSQTTRFKAVSIGAGITNLYSMYGSNDLSGFLKSFFGNYPWRDPQEYAKHSAITFVDRVKTPVLIQHGEQDFRVPYSQAQEFCQALKDRKVPVEFVSYPRQGHGIIEPRLLRDAMQRNLNWFDKWVKGKK